MGEKLDMLKRYLATKEPGCLGDSADLEKLLISCWGELLGWDFGGMTPYKLRGRLEDVHWEPPSLELALERHGALKQGGTRAEVLHWVVNVEEATADCVRKRVRQLAPLAPRVDVRPIATSLAEQIHRGEQSSVLRWKGPDELHVVASLVFPDDSGFQRTLQGRRKRLHEELARLLAQDGWEARPRNRFVRPPNPKRP